MQSVFISPVRERRKNRHLFSDTADAKGLRESFHLIGKFLDLGLRPRRKAEMFEAPSVGPARAQQPR